MRILFISRSKAGSPSIIVFNQGESLKKAGVDLDYFLIEGRSIKGYLKAILTLRRIRKSTDYHLFHAHYSFSGIIASLAGCGPLVVSLMGSDVKLGHLYRLIIRIFSRLFWSLCIVKTAEMKSQLKIRDLLTIPNGVDLDLFKPADRSSARNQMEYNPDDRIVLFLADPQREEKNFELAARAVDMVEDSSAKLVSVYNQPYRDIPVHLNSADLLLLTSRWEGSVNAVKEAMACNIPVISTEVGDVRRNLDGVIHCHITTEDPADISDKIGQVLASNARSDGRERIKEIGLDSESIAKRIVKAYSSVRQ